MFHFTLSTYFTTCSTPFPNSILDIHRPFQVPHSNTHSNPYSNSPPTGEHFPPGGGHSTLHRGSLMKSHGRRRKYTPPRGVFHPQGLGSIPPQGEPSTPKGREPYPPKGSLPLPRGGNHTPPRGVFHPQGVGFILPHGEPSTPRVGQTLNPKP
jgi:hypothetical protein